MTKYTFLSLILISHFFTVDAQKSKIEYGFQGGINLNSAYGSSIAKEYRSTLHGISIGGHFKINSTEHFGIKAMLSYDQYGWAYRSLVFENNLFSGTTSDILFKLNYLNLPVVAEYSFGHKVKINVGGGAFTGLLLNSKTRTKINGTVPLNQQAVSETSAKNYKKINFGFAIGAGIQIPLTSRIAFDVNLRNYTGIVNIYKSNSSSSGNATLKTISFSALGGLTFKM